MSNAVSFLTPTQQAHVDPYLPTLAAAREHHEALPFVTLTYACSLDAMIASAPGVRTAISGLETKSMTHYLRLRHDAILVGAGTAAADDPALNCRYPGADIDHQPQPVVVDPNGRWKFDGDSKAFKLAAGGQGKAPWIVTRNTANAPNDELRKLGGQYLAIGQSETAPGVIDWHQMLATLKKKGITSIMVEGGAAVINTLLARPELVDAVIITVAPIFLGKGGLSIAPQSKSEAGGSGPDGLRLNDVKYMTFGHDNVVCGRPQKCA